MKDFSPYLAVCGCIATITCAVFRYFRARNANAALIKAKKIEAERDLKLEKIRLRKEIELAKKGKS